MLERRIVLGPVGFWSAATGVGARRSTASAIPAASSHATNFGKTTYQECRCAAPRAEAIPKSSPSHGPGVAPTRCHAPRGEHVPAPELHERTKRCLGLGR